MLRKLFIVAVLLWAMAQLGSFAGLHLPSQNASMTMVAFGFIILAAHTLGAIAERLHLPHITGYLLAGLVCGPYVLGLLSEDVVADLKVFDVLAIALIATEAGASLNLGTLRSNLRSVATTAALMTGLLLLAGVAFAFLSSGVLPGIELDFIASGGTGMIVAVGLLLGTVFVAASPPVTMAVISDARAKGRFTDLILTLVIFIDIIVVVLLAGILAITPALSGMSEAAEGGAGLVLAELGWSALLGAVAATIMAGALRYLKDDALLVIVGMAFVMSWVAGQVHASPLLTFLAAGIILNNATSQGEAFKAVAHKLAGPVFVLFFTLLGADLHLDAVQAMAGFAVAMVLLRLGGMYVAFQSAARLVSLPETVRRFGALGVAPQAGIALAVAATVGRQFPGWGDEFKTLAFSAIALNEMFGPVLLKSALNLAGESGRQAPTPHPDEAAPAAPSELEGVPQPRLSEWLPEPGRPDFDPWGGPPSTGARRLDDSCRELQRDLDAMVRDLRSGVVARRRADGQAFLQLLRKEFLRSQRRIAVRAANPATSHSELWTALAAERGDLAGRWKALLLDHAATLDFRAERTAVAGLLEGVDRSTQVLPVVWSAPMDALHLARQTGERRVVTLRRIQARFVHGIARLAGRTPQRLIEPRAIARFTLVGHVPIYLRDAVGLLVAQERYVLARIRNLFDLLDHLLSELSAIERNHEDGVAVDPTRRLELLGHLRDEVEEEFRLLSEAVDRFADETVRVTATALGRAYREHTQMLTIAGTPSLAPRDYRFSKVFEASKRSTSAILEGLEQARAHTRGAAVGVAMEMDIVRLTEQVRTETERIADEASRDVRGRIVVQLARVQNAVDEAIVHLRACFNTEASEPELLLEGVEEILSPVSQVIDEVVGISQSYRNRVRSQPPFEQIMSSLAVAVESLTERFQVVFEPNGPVGRGIPAPPTVVDVPFRDLVRAWQESETGRELSALSARLQDQVDAFARGVEEIDRMLVFHTELTRAELEGRADSPVSDESLGLLQHSLIDVLERLARKAHEQQESSEVLAREVSQGVRTAVLGNLARLRGMLVSGNTAELRARLTQMNLAQGRRELAGVATRAAGSAGRLLQIARTTLGEEALQDARRAMGLPGAERRGAVGPDAFVPAQERVDIPLAYRRLFSDRALEAGDLLAGREDEVARLRRILTGKGPGHSRAVTLVGVGGMGRSAVMQALLRGLGDRVRLHRVELTGPIQDQREVDDLLEFARHAHQQARPTVVTVDGLNWLFELRPHGFDQLRKFLDCVVETSGEVGWLVSADRPVWAYISRLLPFADAFPERMDIDILDPAALRRAILDRHAMSGYRLDFRRPDESLLWWLREVLSSRRRERDLFERHYFERLHQDCGGVLRDAQRFWMASIVAIEAGTDTIHIGSPPPPPIRSLRELPDDLIITLRQVARAGRITPASHALQFQLPETHSLALLGRLVHWGLLRQTEDEGIFVFRDEVAGAIYRILRERRLVG